ncbi:hypothetical protein Tco_0483724 [Tanacetum coccineum]
MHNNIMAAGSRDRPPMLATGRYAQWRSRFLRYIDTRPNGDALRKCILKGPYTPTIVTTPAVPATEDSPAVPEQTTVETVTNMTPKNRAHFESEKEAIHLILTMVMWIISRGVILLILLMECKDDDEVYDIPGQLDALCDQFDIHLKIRGMKYFSFGRHLDELHVTWAHLEKKRTRLQTNTKTLEDLYSQSLETASQAIHDAVTTHQVTESQHSMTASARTDSNATLSCRFSYAQAKRLFGNEDVWVEMHRGITWDKVENSDPQSTPQVLPSFEEYTPPVTCPKEVEETLRTPMEVEPLDETQLEDLGLNTCNHDIPFSNREVPSFDE